MAPRLALELIFTVTWEEIDAILISKWQFNIHYHTIELNILSRATSLGLQVTVA